MDTDAKKVTVDGADVSFTKTEYELLKLFLENRGKVFSREQLLSSVWLRLLLPRLAESFPKAPAAHCFPVVLDFPLVKDLVSALQAEV